MLFLRMGRSHIFNCVVVFLVNLSFHLLISVSIQQQTKTCHIRLPHSLQPCIMPFFIGTQKKLQPLKILLFPSMN
jgi:hypothetical protein